MRTDFANCKFSLCSEISGSQGGEYEDGCLMGCCAVKSGRSLPTFQRCLMPPSSGRWWRLPSIYGLCAKTHKNKHYLKTCQQCHTVSVKIFNIKLHQNPFIQNRAGPCAWSFFPKVWYLHQLSSAARLITRQSTSGELSGTLWILHTLSQYNRVRHFSFIRAVTLLITVMRYRSSFFSTPRGPAYSYISHSYAELDSYWRNWNSFSIKYEQAKNLFALRKKSPEFHI
jgi:hypothetical protein